jgi:hypothetical protein
MKHISTFEHFINEAKSLLVYPSSKKDHQMISNWLEKSDFHAEEEKNYFSFPVADQKDADITETELDKEFSKLGADARFVLENVKETPSLDLSKWKIGDKVEFSNGEIWKVAKPGYKKSSDSIFLAPFNDIAKKGHISLPIEFTADELTNPMKESGVNEASVQIAGHGKPSGAQVLATVIVDHLIARDFFKPGIDKMKKDVIKDIQKVIMDSTF